MNCELKFRNTLLKEELITNGDGIVLAVSGGCDSMVMLEMFAHIKDKYNLKLYVAHVNHGLRGESSDRDEENVKSAASRHRIPFVSTKWKFTGKGNLQNEARAFRLNYLTDVAGQVGASVISTAHHEDDQAETVLLHLIRGTGLKGLSGISPKTEIKEGLALIRPLINISRSEVEAYAIEKSIAYSHDETNASDKYLRNAIRLTLLPEIEKYNPKIKANLANMANMLREDEDLLSSLAADFAEEKFENLSDRIEFSRRDFLILHKALRKRVLIAAYEKICGSRANLNADQIEHMVELSDTGNAKCEYPLPGEYTFQRKNDRLCIAKPK